MFNFSQTIYFLVIVFFVFGCAPLYQPSSIHVPELEEKGDISVQGTYKLSNDVNVNAVYALTDQSAVMLHTGYMYFDGPYGGYHEYIKEESYSVEVGYGSYKHNDDSYSSYFGGVGVGYHFSEGIPKYSENSIQFAKGDFVKAFFQYGMGINSIHKIDIAFMGRINYVYTYNFSTGVTGSNENISNYWDKHNKQHILSLEPAVEFRVYILPHTEIFLQHAIGFDVINVVSLFITENEIKDFSSVGLKVKISEMF